MKTKAKIFTTIAILLLAFMIGLIVLWPTGRNKDYVILTGYVHDKVTGQPLDKCKVAVFNCIINDDDSYGRDKILYATTDADGFYEMEIENSYLMYVRVYKKGYALARSGSVRSQRETEQNFVLEKGASSEDDLYKEEQVNEIIK